MALERVEIVDTVRWFGVEIIVGFAVCSRKVNSV